jgi:hypothetical protein
MSLFLLQHGTHSEIESFPFPVSEQSLMLEMRRDAEDGGTAWVVYVYDVFVFCL